MEPVTLRLATASDAEFIYQVCEAALRPIVESHPLRKWAVDRMRVKCKEDSLARHMRIVQCDGQDCGYFSVEHRPTEVWLEALLLLPGFQRRGIGSHLMEHVFRAASASSLPVRLSVMRGNSAEDYYERMGFIVYEEEDNYFSMERAA